MADKPLYQQALEANDKRRELIFEALGAASTCWIGGTGDRVFDSAQAERIGNGLIAELFKLEQPNLGKATTEQLFNELQARRDGGSHPDYTTVSEEQFDDDPEYFESRLFGLTADGQPVPESGTANLRATIAP